MLVLCFLLASTSLLLLSIVSNPPMVAPDPILAPELKYCHLPLNLPDGEAPFDCCAPDWDRPAVGFTFDDVDPSRVRVRRPAHDLDARDIALLDRAYGLMKALPDDDPRSFRQQANIHCAYCDAAYQMGNSSTPLQVHTSWLFFPFHRFYVYFHERILAHLLKEAADEEADEDDDARPFALPFWNYDHPDGMTIPAPFVTSGNLTDRNRDPSRLPPAIAMIDFVSEYGSLRTREEQIAANLAAFHRTMVSAATTQYAFFGQPYRKGAGPEPGSGTAETMPHNSIHGWVGDQFQVGFKDMGSLYAAARDPLFYAHHASIDRLWEAWKGLGNTDLTDPDFLDSEFVFYNEHAELVKVSVRDSLDPIKLGFTYADVDNLWLNVTLPNLSGGTAVASLSDTDMVCSLGEPLLEPCSLVLAREVAADVLDAEEMVVVEGIEGALDSAAHFEAFVNLPQANASTTVNCAEFLGRFSALPQVLYTNMTGNYRKTSAWFSVGENVRSLGLSGQESIVVTLVPRVESPYSPVSVKSIGLYYETKGLSGNRMTRVGSSISA